MAHILLIDTSTTNCSVAVATDGTLLTLSEHSEGYTHAENLNKFVGEVLSEAELDIQQLDAVAVGLGPGSYTGLRIGVSSAKGLAYGLEVPVIGVNTLDHLASRLASVELDDAVRIIPMLDARRMEVYCGVYDRSAAPLSATEAVVVDESSFEELDKFELHFIGPGVEKCMPLLDRRSNPKYYTDALPSARDMIDIAFRKYEQEDFEDLAYFEPFYLKEFLATTPKSRV